MTHDRSKEEAQVEDDLRRPSGGEGGPQGAARAKASSRSAPAGRGKFSTVYARLRDIVRDCGEGFDVLKDTPGEFCLAKRRAWQGRDVWLAGVRMGKGYVSYYRMPVYMFPDLHKVMSDGLKHRMQDKSCFNFTGVDEILFGELADLTRRGAALLRQRGFV